VKRFATNTNPEWIISKCHYTIYYTSILSELHSTSYRYFPKKTRGVSHGGLAIYIKKYLKAKEELWKLKYFTMQKYNLQKIL
jgi:hypothetical protein